VQNGHAQLPLVPVIPTFHPLLAISVVDIWKSLFESAKHLKLKEFKYFANPGVHCHQSFTANWSVFLVARNTFKNDPYGAPRKAQPLLLFRLSVPVLHQSSHSTQHEFTCCTSSQGRASTLIYAALALCMTCRK